MSKSTYTVDMFIQDGKRIHGDKYDYSKVKNFRVKKDKVTIVCPKHGEFEQQIVGHLNGYGCKKCGFEKTKNALTLDFDSFIKKAKEKYGNKFTYHKDTYVNASESMKITCPTHGDFYQSPRLHISDTMLFGCKKCGHEFGKGKAITKEVFIQRIDEKFNNNFTFEKMNYVNFTTPVTITCKIHGDFTVTPVNMYNSEYGCSKCALVGRADTNKVDFDEFVKIANKKHDNRYTYKRESYNGIKSRVTIICPVHGEFDQFAYNHSVIGHGCSKCSGKHQHTTEEWIERAKAAHGDLYDYSKVKYIDKYTHVTIICPKHGEFQQSPDGHVNSKSGCPKCKASIPERIIIDWLDENKIPYKFQYMFPGVKSRMRYDFYLNDLNLLLEYDGGHHHKKISHYEKSFKRTNGIDSLYEYTKNNDKKKEEIAKSMNVPLLRITYQDNDIISKLKYLISKHYKYRVGNKFYKNFTDLCKGEKLPLNTTAADVKEYHTF